MIIYGIVEQYGTDGLIVATILAGIILVIMGICRFGSLIKYIPYTITTGFTCGIAVTLFVGQLKDFFGLEMGAVPSEFMQKIIAYANHISTINAVALGIGALAVVIMLVWPKVTDKIPGSLVAIIITTAIVYFANLPVNTIGSVYGELNSSFPAFHMPSVSFELVQEMLSPAFTIAILAGIESLLSAVVSDGMIGDNHKSNAELIGQGLGNIFSGLFGGIPATGAIARTAANVRNGGRTPIAGITHAVVLLLIMLFFGKWASLIPMSCLAGILIVVSYNMSEWRSFRSILRASMSDVVILLVTFFLTVLVDLTVAIEIGVVLAALLFMKRMADNAPKEIIGATNMDSDVLENYKDLPKGLGIYEISGPFFFGSAKTYCETIRNLGVNYEVLIIRMRHVPFVDSTGLKNLRETILQLKNEGTYIVLSGVSEPVKKDLLKGGIGELVGVENIYPKFDLALQAAKEKIEEK